MVSRTNSKAVSNSSLADNSKANSRTDSKASNSNLAVSKEEVSKEEDSSLGVSRAEVNKAVDKANRAAVNSRADSKEVKVSSLDSKEDSRAVAKADSQGRPKVDSRVVRMAHCKAVSRVANLVASQVKAVSNQAILDKLVAKEVSLVANLVRVVKWDKADSKKASLVSRAATASPKVSKVSLVSSSKAGNLDSNLDSNKARAGNRAVSLVSRAGNLDNRAVSKAAVRVVAKEASSLVRAVAKTGRPSMMTSMPRTRSRTEEAVAPSPKKAVSLVSKAVNREAKAVRMVASLDSRAVNLVSSLGSQVSLDKAANLAMSRKAAA